MCGLCACMCMYVCEYLCNHVVPCYRTCTCLICLQESVVKKPAPKVKPRVPRRPVGTSHSSQVRGRGKTGRSKLKLLLSQVDAKRWDAIYPVNLIWRIVDTQELKTFDRAREREREREREGSPLTERERASTDFSRKRRHPLKELESRGPNLTDRDKQALPGWDMTSWMRATAQAYNSWFFYFYFFTDYHTTSAMLLSWPLLEEGKKKKASEKASVLGQRN